MVFEAVLYIVAVVLLVFAACGVTPRRVSLPLYAAACALLAFAWPAIRAAFQ